MKPFLKWAGNKYQIIDRIKDVLPSGKRLIEPFVGSGALFLNTDYPEYLLADANPDLISVYHHLQTGGRDFIEACRAYFTPENNTPERFYAFRERFNQTPDATEKAMLFVYLNKHCYNGLCRYNSKGGFNVPFGRHKSPYFPSHEMIYFINHSVNATFINSDFRLVLSTAEPGDVIYCDPPYVPISETAHFTNYSTEKFGFVEQDILASSIEDIVLRGVTIIVSNHDTDYTRKIYSKASKMIYFDVRRHISCDGANRKKVDELLAIYLPI